MPLKLTELNSPFVITAEFENQVIMKILRNK